MGSVVDSASNPNNTDSLPQRIRWRRDGSVLVLIPQGPFRRGTTDSMASGLLRFYGANHRWLEDERPARIITLSSFYLDIFPVTNRQFRIFCENTHHRLPAYIDSDGFRDPDQPVVGIGWEDAAAFCAWAGKRLPTEAEWEKSARGPTDYIFPWGDEYDADNLNAGSRVGRPTRVGSFPLGASVYGIHDMSGNVYEWVHDWYDAEYYASSPNRNPQGPAIGPSHVLRGGSWINVPTLVRCAERDYLRPPDLDNKFMGFRSAIGVETAMAGDFERL